MTPILFLDIDGCLNTHSFNEEADSCGIDRRCVYYFNRILVEARPLVVLSSAWRYLVINGSMALGGFSVMLRTHGVNKLISELLVGVTRQDTMIDGKPKENERGEQISDWRAYNTRWKGQPYVVLDDLDLGIIAAEHPFVQTDGKVGLTQKDAEKVIRLLT